ncbi:MAG: FAD:protein FMN transferase [Candidatus Aminicenantales bacterium]|jgi:thiamine biosynthesis lipoprotein
MTVHRFAHQAMGTYFEIFIAGGGADYAGQAAQAGFAEIDRLDRLFSRFDMRSEIYQINRLSPGGRLLIGVEAYQCLAIGESARRETGGAFDVNVRGRANPRNEGLDESSGAVSEAAFELIERAAGYEIRRQEGPTGEIRALDLDLGAIGKGFALDAALGILSDWDVENVLLHGGTSTALAAGSAPGYEDNGGGWPVGVGGGWPCLGVPGQFILRNRALSGSGTEVKGRHILDPRTGAPASGHVAAWAAHRLASVSDALSTAVMVMSTEDVEAYCAAHLDVSVLAVIDYGRCRTFNWT